LEQHQNGREIVGKDCRGRKKWAATQNSVGEKQKAKTGATAVNKQGRDIREKIAQRGGTWAALGGRLWTEKKAF